MFKLITVFAILAAAFAAPKPDPLTLTTYTAGIPLAYSGAGAIGSPISYSPIGYNYAPYASGYYNYYNAPYTYRNLYY